MLLGALKEGKQGFEVPGEAANSFWLDRLPFSLPFFPGLERFSAVLGQVDSPSAAQTCLLAPAV